MKSLSSSLQESINDNVDEGLIWNIIRGAFSLWYLMAVMSLVSWAVTESIDLSNKIVLKAKSTHAYQKMAEWLGSMDNHLSSWLDQKGISPQVLKVTHSKPFEDYMKSHPSKWDVAEVAEICQKVLNNNADQSAIEGVYKEFKKKNPNISDVEFSQA